MVISFICTLIQSITTWDVCYSMSHEPIAVDGLVWLMVFNTTLNNSSVISWRSVLLVEETIDLSQVTDKLDHISPRHEQTRTHNYSGDRH
jgi:hypothetical protein